MRKIRISNDTGNPMMTRISDAVSGEVYDHVKRVTFYPIDAEQRGPIRAEIEMYVEQIDIVVDATIQEWCPWCGTCIG